MNTQRYLKDLPIPNSYLKTILENFRVDMTNKNQPFPFEKEGSVDFINIYLKDKLGVFKIRWGIDLNINCNIKNRTVKVLYRASDGIHTQTVSI